MTDFGAPNSRVRRVEQRLALITLALVVAVLTGCAAPAPTPATRADGTPVPVVLTTFTVLADMAREVAGDHLQVESITKAGAEIHGYEVTPGDIRRAAHASLILDNGLGLEAWFERFVAELDVPHVVVSDGITPIPIGEDAYAGRMNPHAWMSPLNAQIYVDNIARAFAELDPLHAADYAANAAAYRAELQQVADSMLDRLAALPQHERALVTCEGAFPYLARDAGLTEAFIWAVNADRQGSPAQMARTTEFVRERQVPAVFCESTVSADSMLEIARDTGARFGGVLYVDSLSAAEGPVPTFLDLLRHDTDVIVAGLTGTPTPTPTGADDAVQG
ncbi:metal ABC transporter substrate-binding protein [Nakamurella leprariae]|uniref:Metal ABC transporter substrate-binding protein n=1 Tax=Nakamurella leprariae TaxID=2803911 RepID=A0A939BXM6_9ACTN|nr:metal ABC transporter substrate-binding protein [Nakamurella leprariae]MBM9468713.1 metal ABC transporter substrate-binding protein [Nakamurella leprariae]